MRHHPDLGAEAQSVECHDECDRPAKITYSYGSLIDTATQEVATQVL
jgi:hypothetical protein